ncbi:MAG TPA: hypothetical protein DCY13_05790, partial [Verrucomicrobiales bacterium]|nr:hypothetical protein [Verrucomicrobiales bacterium]
EILGGRYVRAGDDLEAYRPGYKIISDEQKVAPTHLLAINGSSLSVDRRDVILSTAPHPWQCNYVLKLGWRSASTGRSGMVRSDYTFGGVRADWTPANGSEPAWSGWLPHPNLDVARSFTRGSARHEAFFKQLDQPGTLNVSGQLLPRDLAQRQEIDAMSRVVKKGVSTLPPDPAARTVTLLATGKGSWRIGNHSDDFASGKLTSLERGADEGNISFSIANTTGPGTALTLTTHSAFDPHERPLAPKFIVTPDAPVLMAPGAPAKSAGTPALIAGNAARGAELFKTACAICHTFRGEGRAVGPDLSNSPERDLAALRQDILQPNATLNPDHLAFEIEKKDGTVIVGVVASDRPGRFLVHQASLDPVEVESTEIRQMRQLAVSLMPEGLDALGEDGLRDVLTYLTSRVPDPKKP